MILLLKTGAGAKGKELLEKKLRSFGIVFRTEKLRGREAVVLECYPSDFSRDSLSGSTCVEKMIDPSEEYFLASLERKPRWRRFGLGAGRTWKIGELLIAAGPCAVEGEKSLEETAQAVKAAGGRILRGGSFKPRTSPYSFQGLGEEGLKIHRKAADRHGLLMLTEVLDRLDLKKVYDIADMMQVGSRNMQNFPLLRELGKLEKPVLLKRGFGSTREELLLAAEYILKGGNEKVILCERGVRGFNPAGKHILDLASIALLKEMTWLPIIADPSHAAGESRFVPMLAKAAVIAGAEGLLMEVHPAPKSALSDGPQAMTVGEFRKLARELKDIVRLSSRKDGAGK
ncbi:MAG TPA: 3-deoxy-7-phosphoheptulonate synthase [Acidobacteriota bacterium]|jgi:3-deoxy-7-phosphoheptulonate synthase|nr:3-deoxy-7-phosphoheptulonate synthase [Acidobacteriota bacterium]HNT17714.1 3-deoxy-7-phosphoheptulonate synthase [Acidobacteriota bacterium]HPA27390.1 3-deoxy-7-phosphoheptulonate synthase [Acidobacteriota bacterium]HQO20142.1 3-deoxy-7-phosphoheptulonate synthase [Acidobacteriota bacterium]HQQ47144.1 3-deoxy-7-phosphoheptulonate synthase [Acidobacteriota bacterium]